MTAQPVFVLCAPRSFSSVLIGMLGRHHDLYGFAELNLFLTDTVGDLLQLQREESPHAGDRVLGYTSGMLRAVAEVNFGSQTPTTISQAHDWLETHAEWSTRRLFSHLLERVAPRIGVEKSVRTAMSRQSMSRLSGYFSNARFVHLTRHPQSTWRSLIAYQRRFLVTPDSENEELSVPLLNHYARLCITTHRHILEFLAVVGSSRCLRLSGEALLANPEQELARTVGWLGLDTAPPSIEEMLHPEKSPFAFGGLPGIGGDSDEGFLKSPSLRRGSSVPVLTDQSPDGLQENVWRDMQSLAVLLGY